ncbi:MAG: FmdB family zinc ribbon protein [Coriobacteriia bacterium]|nr:FmdB family zinc ribbon protein [Coriobacteriia bacterium]
MPSYDFRCTACELVFEVTRPMTSSKPERCPVCDATTKRVFTPVGVAFKGSGFHNTDYRPKPSEQADTACPAKSDSKPGCTGCPAAE